MNIVADESVDASIVARLRSENHRVIYIAELSPSVPDTVVLSQANELGALLLTADKNFGELVFRQKLVTHGVVLLRLMGLSLETKAETRSLALRDYGSKFDGRFSVLSPGVLRVRPAI